MDKTLELYLDYLKEQKNYSPNTIDSYKRDIDMFLAFMKDEGFSLKYIDANLIRNFLRRETEKGISKRSNQRRIIAMRRYFEWLFRELCLCSTFRW